MDVSADNSLNNSIAIIGMAGRFPGAMTLEEYWDNLYNGRETLTFFTKEELLEAGVKPERLANPNFVPARGVYKNALHFDARFFGYTPRDAELIDPQQRIFLECCWEAMEMAGHDASNYPGRVGVFAGTGMTSYMFELLMRPRTAQMTGFNIVTSADRDYVATRVGYKLGLRGPCITVQTACSTSLVAAALGCQSLLTYQTDLILAGGATIDPVEVGGYDYAEGGILSPDGHCRSFDASAKGTIFGSGAGVVVLKRFEDALADNDQVYAVIRGFGMNNDGAMRAGYTAPGVDGQTAVSTEALTMSGIDPETISYVECHGTATNIGDPIEVKALSRAFGAFTKKKNFCAIGSVKSNIGHCDSAAGVAGLIKTVLSMRNRALPPTLHFKEPNPELQIEETPFFVNDKLREWKADGPLRAGVNSFGIGGTNAHVIVEEAPALPETSASRPWQLLVWSARTPAALDAMTDRLKQHLREKKDLSLPDLAYTLQVGRKLFEHRRFLLCRTAEGAVETIDTPSAASGPFTFPQGGANAPKFVFLFPGQGAQHVNMARELYQTEAAFRRAFDECAAHFREHLGEDLKALIYPEAGGEAAAAETIQQTKFTQPVLFAVEYALARQWEQWGVKPSAMVGHSIGEYVAACMAGVMSVADAAALVAGRARLMQGVPAGSMLSVMLPEADVRGLLKSEPGISLAAVNGPSACVVSGPTELVEAFAQKLQAQGTPSRTLKTSHAFHSAMMEPMLPAFFQLVRGVKLSPPKSPYLSNLTGAWITPEEATSPEYWVQHLRQPVKFSANVAELVSGQQRLVFIEVGPGRALSTLVTQQAGRDPNVQVVSSLPSATQEDVDSLGSMLKALGQLWAAGAEVDWKGFYAAERRRRVASITYPFEREKYGTIERPAAPAPAAAAKKSSDRREFDEWFLTPTWLRTTSVAPSPQDGQNYVVFSDSPELAGAVGGALAGRGAHVTHVSPGAEFRRTPEGGYTVRLDDETDYDSLLTALAETERVPNHFVHALGVMAEHTEDGVGHANEVLDRCFYSPLYLVKSLGRSGKPVRVSFVTSRAYDVVGSEPVCPAASTVFGPATSAVREMKNLGARMIDVDAPGGRIAADDLRLLVDEICHAGEHEVSEPLAVRGGYRWKRTNSPLPAPNGAQAEHGFRENGVYLVTGGMGGIGLAAAEHLAREAKARLVLIGRSAVPARETWDEYLAGAGEADATAEKIRGLRRLEELGAEVLVCQADVADEAEMERAVAQARERFGPINGVIHAAGIPSEGIIELKKRDGIESVLRPKVRGSVILDKLMRDEELDFFVLCASLVGVLGSAGQVDYTAGNAFMDSFAWSKRKAAKNRPVSIDWDRWDEVGMAARQIARGNAKGAAKPARFVEGDETELSHPIFARRIKGQDHDTYVLDLSAETQWVAGEHKIVGLPTMVGTSHLELLRAAYEASEGTAGVEIRDLIFIQPVMLQEGERRDVFYTLKEERNGRREFAVWSVSNGMRLEHSKGSVGPVTETSAKSYDAEEIFKRCGNTRPPVMAEGVSTDGTPAVVQTSKRWDIFTRIADSEREAIAELKLTDTHLADMETFVMHPAVLDCATSFASGPIFQSMYLPLAYQRLRVLKGLTPTLYSYKQFPPPAGGGIPEVISCDIVLFDEAGEPVVEIEGFTVKRVADPAAMAARANTMNAPKKGGHQKTSNLAPRINTEEGIKALVHVIERPWTAQVIVHVGDPNAEVTIDQVLSTSAEGEGQADGGGQVYARPALGTPYVAPRSELEAGIAEIWQSVLGIDKIGVIDDFLDLGGHSLIAVQLTSRISETFGIEFPVSQFYQQPTVEGVAQSILLKLAEGLQDSSLEELLGEQEAGAVSA